MRSAFRNFRCLIALADLHPIPMCGAVAQLGERLNGIQEVIGSIPFGSTTPSSPSFVHRLVEHLEISRCKVR